MSQSSIQVCDKSNFNPYPPEFLKWTHPPSHFGTIDYPFWGYQDDDF